MLKLILLSALALSLSGCSDNSSLTGSWAGAATFRGAELPTTVRFVHNAQTISATISTPDAYQLNVPLRNVRYEHPNLHFEVEEAGERLIFEGTEMVKPSPALFKVVNCEQSSNSSEQLRTNPLIIPRKKSAFEMQILNSTEHYSFRLVPENIPPSYLSTVPALTPATTTASTPISSQAAESLRSFTIRDRLAEQAATTNSPMCVISPATQRPRSSF